MNTNFELLKALTIVIKVEIVTKVEDLGEYSEIIKELKPTDLLMNFENKYYTINSIPSSILFWVKINDILSNLKNEINQNIENKLYKHQKYEYISELIYEIEKINKKYNLEIPADSEFQIYKMLNKEIICPDEFKYSLKRYIDGSVLLNISNICVIIKNILVDFIEFLNHKLKVIEFLPDVKIDEIQKNKLKTNLSVPEIAYLFYSLIKLKPNLFDYKHETEIYRFISNNFTSKKSAEISEISLKKCFNSPEINEIEFWETHYRTLITNLMNLKESLKN